jgi:hypothetical protein
VCSPGRGSLAFPALAVRPPVSMQRTASLSSYRPLNQLRPGSFSLGVPPPQSSFAQISRGHLSMAAYLPRVSSLIAASPERVHISRRMPGLRFVPSSGFRSLSTVSSALRLRGLIPSRSHVQGCRRSGASLPAQPTTSSVVCAPVPLSSRALTGHCPAARFRAPPAAGCHTRGCLDFEAFLRARQRCVRFGVSLPAARSPLRFSSPPGRQPPPWFWFPKTSRSRRCLPEAFIPRLDRPQRVSAAG